MGELLTFLARGDQFWLPKSVRGAKFGPCIMIRGGTVFGKGGPSLAAKIGPGDHFFRKNRSGGTTFGGTDFGVTDLDSVI